jgi:hypothetical protein
MRHLLVILGCLWAVMAWGQSTLNSEISIAGGNVGDVFGKLANGKSGFRSLGALGVELGLNISNKKIVIGTGTSIAGSQDWEISGKKLSLVSPNNENYSMTLGKLVENGEFRMFCGGTQLSQPSQHLSFSLRHHFYGVRNNALNFYRGGGVTGGWMEIEADSIKVAQFRRSGVRFNNYTSATAVPITPVASAVFDASGNLGTAQLPLSSISHTTDFTGDGASTPLALATPYLPLTNSTYQHVNMGANQFGIIGDKGRILSNTLYQRMEHYDPAAGAAYRLSYAQVDSTGFRFYVKKGTDPDSKGGYFEYGGYPIRPKFNYIEGSKIGDVMTAITGDGRAEWQHRAIKKISYLVDNAINLSSEQTIVYTQTTGSAVVMLTLPENTDFCGREIQLVRKGTLLGGAITLNATNAIIQNRSDGTYLTSKTIVGNASFLCDCQSGIKWLQSSTY